MKASTLMGGIRVYGDVYIFGKSPLISGDFTPKKKRKSKMEIDCAPPRPRKPKRSKVDGVTNATDDELEAQIGCQMKAQTQKEAKMDTQMDPQAQMDPQIGSQVAPLVLPPPPLPDWFPESRDLTDDFLSQTEPN